MRVVLIFLIHPCNKKCVILCLFHCNVHVRDFCPSVCFSDRYVLL